MEKKSENLILFFLVIFAIYCSLTLGMSWDEPYHYYNGKNRLKYLFSFGKYEYRDLSIFLSRIKWELKTAKFSSITPYKLEYLTMRVRN